MLENSSASHYNGVCKPVSVCELLRIENIGPTRMQTCAGVGGPYSRQPRDGGNRAGDGSINQPRAPSRGARLARAARAGGHTAATAALAGGAQLHSPRGHGCAPRAWRATASAGSGTGRADAEGSRRIEQVSQIRRPALSPLLRMDEARPHKALPPASRVAAGAGDSGLRMPAASRAAAGAGDGRLVAGGN